MRKIFGLHLLILLITLLSYSRAIAQPAPIPSVVATASSSPSSPKLELALLNVGVAEAMREMLINVRTTSRLVGAYETVVTEACMPELRSTLRHAPNPSDPTCREYLNRLIAIDPGNPVAICARDGIDAPACSQAFARQHYSTYDPAIGLSGDATSGPNIEGQVGVLRNEERVNSLELKYMEFVRAFRSGKNPKDREGALALLDQILDLTCIGIELVIAQSNGSGADSQLGFSLSDTNPVATPSPTPRRSDLVPDDSKLPQRDDTSASTSSNPLKILAEELKDNSPTPTPNALDKLYAVRTRVVPENCDAYLERAKLLDPNRASVVCAKEGAVSPNCISARRLARHQALVAQKELRSSAENGAVDGAVRGAGGEVGRF